MSYLSIVACWFFTVLHELFSRFSWQSSFPHKDSNKISVDEETLCKKLLLISIIFLLTVNLLSIVSTFWLPFILVSSIGVQLEDCNFHESVDLTDFDSTKTLAVCPTDGEVSELTTHLAKTLKKMLRIFWFPHVHHKISAHSSLTSSCGCKKP